MSGNYLRRVRGRIQYGPYQLFATRASFTSSSAKQYCEGKKGYCTASSSNAFVLATLPLYLQKEFDLEENANLLRHLVRRTSPVVVSPNWLCEVAWKCTRCHCKWTARPTERVSNQLNRYSGCPQCREEAQKTLEANITTFSTTPSSPSMLLHIAYPHLSTEWKGTAEIESRNAAEKTTFFNVSTTSSIKVQWKCRQCARLWKQSVRERVMAIEQQRNDFSHHEGTTFCPDCEAQNGIRPLGNLKTRKKSSLSDHSILLSEVHLRPHQDPRKIHLTSAIQLTWQCSYCQWKYVASLKNRYLYHETCPRCAGKQKDSSNSLQIQRPDVQNELKSKYSSSYLLGTKDTNTMKFTCKKCHATYNMTLKSRCLLSASYTLCPKCLYNKTF